MSKKLMSLLSLVLVLCMVLAMVAGCASTPAETPSEGGEKGEEGEAYVPEAPMIGSFGDVIPFTQYWDMASHNVEQTEIFKELCKRTGSSVTYEVPTSDDGQKLNIMMSSGDLPEIITTPRTNAAVGKMIAAGAVYCINDLMEQYYPSMLTDIEPEYLDYHKYKDGKNYYWTNYIYTEFVLNHDTWPKVEAVFRATSILSDVYEAIGKPDVSTPEAYAAMLKMVKEKYPDMATLYLDDYPGQAASATTSESSLFINSDSASWAYLGEWGLTLYDVDENKNVTSVIRNPKFKEMAAWMNSLYQAGYIDPAAFVDGSDIGNSKVDNGQVAVFHGTIGNHAYINGSEQYTPLPYFETINGEPVEGIYNKSGAGWLATMVNSNTKGPKLEAVMNFLGYQTTMEGRQLCGWGIEGVHWEWNEDKTAPVKTAIWDNMEDPSDYTKKWGFWQNRALHDQYYCNSLFEVWTDERLAWYEIYGDRMKLDIFDGVRNPPVDDSTEGMILAKLCDLSFTEYPKLIMASSDAEFEKAYNNFVTKADELGLATLEAYWTERYKLFNN